jgi:hypothetical protein
MRPPVTPEQWQGRVPQSGPYAGQPQYPPRQDQQPAFTPDPWHDSQQPGGQYAPPQPGWQPQQPAWQQPYQPQPQYAPGPPSRRKRHTARNVLAGIGGLIGVIIVISLAANSGHGLQTAGSPPGTGAQGAAHQTAGIGSAITLAGNSSGEQMAVTVTRVITTAQPGDEFSSAPAGDRLYAVQFRLADTGSAAYSDAPSNGAAVVDSVGQSYNASLADNAAGCAPFSSPENIAPSSSGLGCIVFEVPKSVKITRAQFTLDSGMGPDTGQWNVG